MNKITRALGRVVGVIAVGAAITHSFPALADTGLPPAKYDLAPDATTVYEIEKVELGYFGDLVPLYQVPVGQAKAECDFLSMIRFGQPYPASETAGGGRLYGCLIRNRDDSNPQIVISFDNPELAAAQGRTYDPNMAARLLRHELGHVNGWPGTHPR